MAVDVELVDTHPLTALLGAFRDHARGKPHPLFVVAGISGQRAHSADNAFRAYVAVAVKLLIRAGVKRKDAIATVAKAINTKSSKVESWYREIGSERHLDAGTIQLYRNMLVKAEEIFPGEPRRAADTLIAMFDGPLLPLKDL